MDKTASTDIRNLRPALSVASSAIRLVHSEGPSLDASAAEVIERLSNSGSISDLSPEDARKAYTKSRVPLLAPLEPVDGVTSFTRAGCPRLTIFRPHKSPNTLLPGLIFFHGGGWTVGSLDVYEGLCRALANATRSVVVWVEYRLAPEHRYPAALEDASDAAVHVQAHAESFGIDPARIGIAGDSAGGNIAAALAIAARDRALRFRPAYQALLYPCLDLTACLPSHRALGRDYLLTTELYAWYRRNYVGPGVRVTDWRVSPLFLHDLTGLAPAVILSAGFDPLRDEAIMYARNLVDAGVPVETLHFPRMIHGFLNMGGVIPAARTAVHRIAASIDNVFHEKHAGARAVR